MAVNRYLRLSNSDRTDAVSSSQGAFADHVWIPSALHPEFHEEIALLVLTGISRTTTSIALRVVEDQVIVVCHRQPPTRSRFNVDDVVWVKRRTIALLVGANLYCVWFFGTVSIPVGDAQNPT